MHIMFDLKRTLTAVFVAHFWLINEPTVAQSFTDLTVSNSIVGGTSGSPGSLSWSSLNSGLVLKGGYNQTPLTSNELPGQNTPALVWDAPRSAFFAGYYQENHKMGDWSACFGVSTASGLASFAANYGNATASYSTAIGLGTRASVFASLVLGSYNVNIPGSSSHWVATDPLLVIGNGKLNDYDEADHSNAFVMLKNGNATFKGVVKVAPGGNIPMFGH